LPRALVLLITNSSNAYLLSRRLLITIPHLILPLYPRSWEPWYR